MTQIDTAFKMGCMAAVGYAIGTALKVDPKVTAIAWLCGEVALQVFRSVDLLPLPKLLAGSFVALNLKAQQIVENSVRSDLIMASAFIASSSLLEKLGTLFNKLCRQARHANASANLNVRAREVELEGEFSDEEAYVGAYEDAYDRPYRNRNGWQN